jgi:cytidine deaminase
MLSEISKYNLEPQEIPFELESSLPQFFDGHKNSIITAAISAEERAEHHSGVHVGCSVLALNKELDLSEPQLYTGANQKKRKGMIPWPERQCAEMQAIKQALDEGCAFIPAIVTVSKSRNTGEKDTLDHDIMHPCKQCQVLFGELLKPERGILSSQTIVYNARIENGQPVAEESMPLGDLLKKLKKDEEEIYLSSLQDFMEVKDFEIESCARSIEIINLDIERQAQEAQNDLTGDALIVKIRDLELERSQRIMDVRHKCAANIRDAWESSIEEGVKEEDLKKNFVWDDIPADPSQGVSQRSADEMIADVERRIKETPLDPE